MSIKTSYISFQDVHFYYNKKNIVLNGINMDINKGELRFGIQFDSGLV